MNAMLRIALGIMICRLPTVPQSGTDIGDSKGVMSLWQGVQGDGVPLA